MKADLSPRRIGRKHQFADGVEDDLELGVIFVFEVSEFTREIGIGEKHLAQANKRAHDYAPASSSSMCPAVGLPQCGMIAMFTWTARELRRTLESMATPCSVKTMGVAPPNFPRVGITVCDTRLLISAAESANIKSPGKRSK